MTFRGPSRALTGLVVATAVLGLVGCVRVETPPPPSRTASAATVDRDTLAASLEEVASAVAAEQSESLAAAVESHSLDALLAGVGPAYVAFPDASATPSPSIADTTVTESAADALATSLDLAQGSSDAEVRSWAATAALVHGLAVWLDAADSGQATLGPLDRGLPLDGTETTLTPASNGSVGSEELADLALRHDQARYLYELVASRLSGQEREDALARAALHGARSDALQALSDAEDTRTEVYSTEASAVADESSRSATLRQAESSVASAYAAYATTGSAEDVRWLLDGAFDAYAAESLLDGWSVWDLPVLPGLEEPAPAATATVDAG